VFLVGTSVWLELLLEQDRAEETRRFLQQTEPSEVAITDFSLHSLGIILSRFKRDDLFDSFISDVVRDAWVAVIRLTSENLMNLTATKRQHEFDFDDAYQYLAATTHGCTLVSFDAHFDRTPEGRKTPADLLPH